MRIYLDLCCLNRPFDDQAQDRIHLESEAVVMILRHVQNEEIELICSDVLELENARNPDRERQEIITETLRLAQVFSSVGRREANRAKELEAIGFGAYDALHVACAESGDAEVLLTTDDQLLRCAGRNADKLRMRVANPVEWVREEIGYE